jgi:ATP-binding cassette, subfamily C, bacterial LapB
MNEDDPQKGITLNNEVHARLETLRQALDAHPQGIDRDYIAQACQTDLGACLLPLLEALHWSGDEIHLARALPHLEPVSSIDEFRSVMTRLGYQSEERRKTYSHLHPFDLPCLLNGDGGYYLITEISEEGLRAYDSVSREKVTLTVDDSKPRNIFAFKKIDREAASSPRRLSWFFDAYLKLKKSILYLALMTFVINLIGLLLPFYTGVVYDKVIATKSVDTLAWLATGVIAALLLEAHIRGLRSRLVGYVGARLDHAVTEATFKQVLNLPLNMTEVAPIASQIARFRQFKGLRDIFTGQFATTLLDLPFALIFCVAIGFIDPILVLVPLFFGLVFLLFGLATSPFARRQLILGGETRNKSQIIMMEILTKVRTIHDLGAEDLFRKRFAKANKDSLKAKISSVFFASILSSSSQSIVSIAAICTLGVGALRVIDGNLTPGGLITTMMFVWRILSPMQAAFLNAAKLGQYKDAILQVDGLMRLKTEKQQTSAQTIVRQFTGHLLVKGVSFRYNSVSEPALRGCSLEIKPGQIVAIAGPTGAGKSTLLKIMMGLYSPQGGLVMMDGLDIRQLDPLSYRNSIGYAPQQSHFFYGTVAQNLRLCAPTASDEELYAALSSVGAILDPLHFPDGLETRLESGHRSRLPEGLKAQLSLARAFVRQSSAVFLDEPGSYLDHDADRTLIALLQRLRGRTSVVIVTNRPSHMRVCDRVIYMREGVGVADGPPEQIVPAILAQSAPQTSAPLAKT